MIIDDVVQVVGRGTIFIVDLIKNGYTEVGYIRTIPISIGDTVEHGGENYEVTGIEAWKIFDAYYKSTIGLKVKKINNMSVKRILENQLELNDSDDGLSSPAGLPLSKKRTFLQELQESSNNFVSPNLEGTKAILRARADEGKKAATFRASEVDSFCIEWFKKQGLQVKEGWSGTREDGYSTVEIKW